MWYLDGKGTKWHWEAAPKKNGSEKKSLGTSGGMLMGGKRNAGMPKAGVVLRKKKAHGKRLSNEKNFWLA